MQTHFEQELEKLRKRIIEMSDLVEIQVEKSITALLTGNKDLVKQIEENENKIDDIDVKIDKLCQRIFALVQPVASDLRLIMSSLKIDNELERIADIALSIAKRAESIREQPEIITKFKINEIANHSKEIFSKAILSYIEKDVVKAKELLLNKDFIKDLNQKLHSKIINEMTKKSEVIVVATNLIIVLQQIERLADHAVNIAESVVFWIDGKIIKHENIID